MHAKTLLSHLPRPSRSEFQQLIFEAGIFSFTLPQENYSLRVFKWKVFSQETKRSDNDLRMVSLVELRIP